MSNDDGMENLTPLEMRLYKALSALHFYTAHGNFSGLPIAAIERLQNARKLARAALKQAEEAMR
jgi:hypothetical protein